MHSFISTGWQCTAAIELRIDMNWLFQGNPKVYPILDDLRIGEPIEEWSVTHSLNKLQPGDRAALWVSGPNAGVYALGTVVGVPEEGLSSDGWINPDDRGRLRWFCPLELDDVFYETPILKDSLKSDSRFSNASILRHPQSGNPFPLTDFEWAAIENLRMARTAVPAETKAKAVKRRTSTKKIRASRKREWHPREIPPMVKLEVWTRDRGRCAKCGTKTLLQFDHVIPWSQGGSSLTADNIQILCAKHNNEKRARIDYEI